MNRSHLIPGALALAACLFSSLAVASAPVQTDKLPDARILSAEPFVFHADNGIFSNMPGDTSDTNIFKPRDTLRSAGDSRLMDERFKHQMML